METPHSQTQFPIIEFPRLSNHLYARRASSILVPRAEVNIGTWKPSPNNCHSNVDEWCRYMREYTPVRGWLYFAFEDSLPYVVFNAHSVVRSPSGQLMDITPSQASQRYPFLIALESEDEYFKLIDQGVSRIRHIKSL